MALVENEGDALVTQGLQLFLEALLPILLLLLVALAILVQRQAQLLDRADNNFIGAVVRQEASDEGSGIGVLLDAAFLKLVELLTRLPIEVLAVHHEKAFFDVGIVLQQR
ncbi:hypothetical protein D3C86_1815010 [compost metagenome]